MTPQISRRIAHWLTPLLPVGLLACALPTSAADPLPAIHVVRVGHGNVVGMRLNAQTAISACQAVKGMPVQPLPLPSDAELAAMELVVEEEYFDNDRWALYKTVRHLGADAQAGCQLAIFFERTAKLETGCEDATHARAKVPDIMADFNAPPNRPAPTVDDSVRSRSGKCNSRPFTANISALPTANAGAGAQCIWASTLLRQSLGKPLGSAEPDTTDFCYYAKRPFYIHNGVKRHVLLKSVVPETNAAGTHMPSLVGALPSASYQLKSLQESASLPASKFTRGGAEAFVNLPRRQSLAK